MYSDLNDFLADLEKRKLLARIGESVSPDLEIAAVTDRACKSPNGGPALLFEKPKGHAIPVLGNLFGTPLRVALGMGKDNVEALREVGKLLAFLKEPDPPSGLADAFNRYAPIVRQVLSMTPKVVNSAPCQEQVWAGTDVDLRRLPIQICWPGDAAPLITWGLVVTRGPQKQRQNLGIYRQQVIGPNKVIIRWLAQRGGALDYRDHCLAHAQGQREGHDPTQRGHVHAVPRGGLYLRRLQLWAVALLEDGHRRARLGNLPGHDFR